MTDYWTERFESMEDIGSGVRISYYVSKDDTVQTGIIVAHKHLDGHVCVGSVLFDIPENANVTNRPKWQLLSRDPLTLNPSIARHSGPGLQDQCLHGYIKQGRWEGC